MSVLVKKCPECGSVNVVKIVYGYPSYELFQDADAGKVRLGGCCISDSNPEYFCRDCENEWNRGKAVEDDGHIGLEYKVR